MTYPYVLGLDKQARVHDDQQGWAAARCRGQRVGERESDTLSGQLACRNRFARRCNQVTEREGTRENTAGRLERGEGKGGDWWAMRGANGITKQVRIRCTQYFGVGADQRLGPPCYELHVAIWPVLEERKTPPCDQARAHHSSVLP